MSPEDYVIATKDVLTTSPVVQDWVSVTEMLLLDRGHFRVRITLTNGDFVEASEFFRIFKNQIEQQRYRYQWMDAKQKQLKKRWDNAPHFPHIESFPHHVHIGQDDNVGSSQMLGISGLIAVLEEELCL
ncbi:hypothetical protein IQ273_23925 [Nodosilinea sp. LEGE 07298]|uniref:toxin-antitoxin system TumE family protein n=1 Tax=Nodosilinea sp. LEGE 07298 TaxID=2777970 RepID=UPI001880323F|nr:DUF6516 family protein [Nodosilinea sp. LEGE 07298]MBE9112446.1 hypothetical protein [Nodosilinea sp. LEGE 07298]